MREARSDFYAYRNRCKMQVEHLQPKTSHKKEKRKKLRRGESKWEQGMSGEADRMGIEEEMDTAKEAADQNNRLNKLKERKVSWAKLRRVDSLNLEAGRVSMTATHPSKVYILGLSSYKLLMFTYYHFYSTCTNN